ncbi:hypothetical protein WN51_03872 [Melipona quadrifasciata]|uniref:Uncharacterized protein n=1 Tax=Melipona quadrifasciata TaxID=166423 RepID=A0A0M9AB12_9HYME|nr:hypothetical protein WN51_03872 [Melipona quadrifasciata]
MTKENQYVELCQTYVQIYEIFHRNRKLVVSTTLDGSNVKTLQRQELLLNASALPRHSSLSAVSSSPVSGQSLTRETFASSMHDGSYGMKMAKVALAASESESLRNASVREIGLLREIYKIWIVYSDIHERLDRLYHAEHCVKQEELHTYSTLCENVVFVQKLDKRNNKLFATLKLCEYLLILAWSLNLTTERNENHLDDRLIPNEEETSVISKVEEEPLRSLLKESSNAPSPKYSETRDARICTKDNVQPIISFTVRLSRERNRNHDLTKRGPPNSKLGILCVLVRLIL